MTLRDTSIDRLRGGSFDVLIVGGGINGAVVAASLAGRGASVALVERGDFASFTSQESSNLVWGGFKYLEHYELMLVYKLCRSRNRLMKAYPDNVTELSFLAALDDSSPYPPWFSALGATAYWAIGGFRTRYPRLLSTARIRSEEPVIDTTVGPGRDRVPGLLPEGQRRPVRVLLRPVRHRGRCHGGQLRRAVPRGTRRRSLAGPAG